jgi:hypothetical protein
MLALLTNWRLLAGISAIVALVLLASSIYRAGQRSERLKHIEQSEKASSDARKIENDAARCTTDPKCLLADPFRVR